jgi:hypothetical protein
MSGCPGNAIFMALEVLVALGAEVVKMRASGRIFARGLVLLGALTALACGDSRTFSEHSSGGASGASAARGGTSGVSSGRGGASGASNGSGGVGGGTLAEGGDSSGAAGLPQGGAADGAGGTTTATSGGNSSGSGAGAGGGAGRSAGGTSGTGALGGRSAAGGAGGVVGVAGSAGAGGAAGITVQQFCDLLQPRARSWLRECRPGFSTDASTWWGTQNIDSFCTSGRAAIEAGRLAYDPVRAEACAAQSVGDCETIAALAFPSRAIVFATQACVGVVSPTVPVGGACHANSTQYSTECKAGFCGGNTCPGSCTAFAKVGESCAQNKPCDPAAAVCNSAAKCQAFAKLGEPCESDLFCSGNTRCAYDAQPVAVCVERRTTGQTCQWPSECGGTSTACYQNKCVDTLPPNASCVGGGACPTGQYCDSTCKARIPANGDCTDAPAGCIEGTYCSEEAKCKAHGQLGEACPCASDLWCDDTNKCRATVKLGGDCSQSTASGLLVRCEAGSLCVPTLLGQNGLSNFTCQGRVGQGELCAVTNNCKAPFFCEPTSSRCQPAAAKDQACNAALPLQSCQPGLFCQCTGSDCTRSDLAGQAPPGICRALAADGANCTSAAECKSGICDTTSKKCTPSPLCL